MSRTTSIDDMAKEVAQIFKDYAAATDDLINKTTTEVSKLTAEELQKTSPKNRGEYAKSWTYGKDTRKRSKNKNAKVVYNQKHYRLTHLLEKGHATRNGGHTGAQPHIAPAAEKAEQELLSKLKKGIEEQKL